MIGAGLLGPQGRRERADSQALGKNFTRSREAESSPTTWRSPGWTDGTAGTNSASIPGRLRLHNMHRQQWSAARTGRGRRSWTRAIWWPRPCFPATGISKGRVNPQVKANYLASPPLVVAYAIAGTVNIDLTQRTAGAGQRTATMCFLKDIWSTQDEIADPRLPSSISAEIFEKQYSHATEGPRKWQAVEAFHRRSVRLDRGEHLHPGAAVLRRHAGRSAADHVD